MFHLIATGPGAAPPEIIRSNGDPAVLHSHIAHVFCEERPINPVDLCLGGLPAARTKHSTYWIVES